MIIRELGLVGFLAVAPAIVFAQEARAPTAPEGPSRLTMERIRYGFVLAPDNRFTEVDGRFGNLFGFYGGWMMDRTIMIGAGGYWLTNGSHDREERPGHRPPAERCRVRPAHDALSRDSPRPLRGARASRRGRHGRGL